MKNIALLILAFLLSSVVSYTQNPNGNYNPFVNSGTISPSPMFPMEASGKGTVSFTIGNTGSDPLEVYTNHYITLTITLSYGLPDNADPLSAIGGTSAGLFSWTYNNGTYSAIQNSTIPENSSGTITIDYKVNKNSSSPGLNGFNVNISPAPYQNESNTQDDDAISSYTYTEIRDYGDAPENYGIADHLLDFENYLGSLWDGETEAHSSYSADGDDVSGENDEDGVIFPSGMKQGDTVNISVIITGAGRLNAWIDWNGDGDFEDEGEHIANNTSVSEGTYELSVVVPEDAITALPTYARFRLSTGSLSSSHGSANGGEVEDYLISIFSSSTDVDNEAPTAPKGLHVSGSTTESISLSWDASTDNRGVKAYKIYRDNKVIGTSFLTEYTDHNVESFNSYNYDITALDAAGNESLHSDPITASAIKTGINLSIIGNHKLKMYPNPTDGTLELEIYDSSGEFTLVIFDAVGKFVENKVIYFSESTHTIDLGHLKSGVYNLNLYNDHSFYYGKLIISE